MADKIALSLPTLHLLVPGLLGPMPGVEEGGCLPDLSMLESLLSRAEQAEVKGGGLSATLFQLFNVVVEEDSDLPSAAVCHLGDTGLRDEACWLHADPVFLKPDGDRLLLFDASHLDLRQEDAERLVARFNEHFAVDGWHLEAPSATRWYLRLPQAPELHTHPLSAVVGRNIDAFLPTGPEGARWHALMNEVQMLFHGADANMQREADRLLPINSLWFSGVGYLPQDVISPFVAVMADEVLAQGLAKLAAIPCRSLPEQSGDLLLEGGEQLVLYHHLQRPVLDADPYAWSEAVGRFQSWLEPLLKMLQQKQLGLLKLYPCNGLVYAVDRRSQRRFWRRRRPFSGYLEK